MKKIILTFILLFVSFGASAEWAVNLQQPITEVGESIYNLHLVITFICLIIFIGVFGFMFYSIYYHRKSRGHKASQFHENTTVEVIWTIIPFVILIAMAWPATKTLLIMRDTSAPDMTIKATGYQWKWGYEYLDHDVQFYSTLTTPKNQITNVEEKNKNYLLEVDNHVVVPVGKKVRVLTTANDVLHAWYVPALAVKQDAIPGFIRDTWFKAEKTGIYRGQCAELCGKEHAYMPIVVEVVTEDQFNQWVLDNKTTKTTKLNINE